MQDLIDTFSKRVIVKNEQIDNVHSWYWLDTDNGAWEGPKNDWITSHWYHFFKNVRKNDVVVQAGGCLGMYPRLLSDIFTKVFTFEPDALNFHVLTMNCQKHNIVKFNCALGSHSGMSSLMRYDDDNVGMHVMQDVPTERIPVMRIDDLGLDECDFICLDVESSERIVLLGAIDTIQKFRPVISCENGNSTIYHFLNSLGYEVQSVSVSDTVYIPKEMKG